MRYPFVNKSFTLALFALPPMLGSAVSVIWHGGALWSAIELASRRRRFSQDATMLAVTGALYAFVAANLVAWLVNGGSIDDLKSYLFLATLLLFPISYSIWSISDKDDIAAAAILGAMVACYGALIFAAIEFHLLGKRSSGGAGNPIVFATITSMAGLVALCGALSLQERWRRYLLGAFVASLIALAYAQSRTVLLSTGLSLAAIAWIYRAHLTYRPTARVWLVTAAAVVTIAIVGAFIVGPRMGMVVDEWRSFAGESDYSSSLGLRVAMWEIAVASIGENPIFGIGRHEVAPLIATALRESYGVDHEFSHFHNGFLTVWVQSGIFGVIALMAVFVIAASAAGRTLYRSSDETKRFGAALLVILIVTYLVGGSTNILIGHDIIDVMLMIFLIVGLYLATGTSMADPQ